MSRSIWIITILLVAAAISYITFAGSSPEQTPDLSEVRVDLPTVSPNLIESQVRLPVVLNSSETDVPPIPSGGPGAATELSAEAQCEQPGKPIARLTWTPAGSPGSEQVVQMTVFSFEPEEYRSSKQLSPEQSSLEWETLSGQASHHWRVLTRQEEGWVSSEISSFEGPTCVGPTPRPPIE